VDKLSRAQYRLTETDIETMIDRNTETLLKRKWSQLKMYKCITKNKNKNCTSQFPKNV